MVIVYIELVYAGIFPFSVGKSIVVCIPAYSSSADGVFTVCKLLNDSIAQVGLQTSAMGIPS